MSIALLDLNDCNLQLWHQDTHVQSPGYALLRGQQYTFGAQARAGARLQPRDINTRYWWQLSTEALQPALGPARHTGDLAHAHLQALHREAQQPSEMVLAVSGTMAHDQLSLLLGIVQQCPFDAVGLVNRSVALGSLYSHSERLFHLEIQLHQAVICELTAHNNTLDLQRTVPLPGCGLLQVQERLVEIIAAAFVRQTRFDPRRKADSEQQLYDALPATLLALQNSSETNVDVNGYQARINSSDLQAAGTRLFDSARESIGLQQPGDQVIADPLAALVPGLKNQFQNLDFLQSNDIHRALLLHQEQLVQRGEGLSFITSLPCMQEKIEPTEETATAVVAAPTPIPTQLPTQEKPPTHLLREHCATPLSASGTALAAEWELYKGEQGWLLRGTGTAAAVNGEAYTNGQTLACGDSISIGATFDALLITVET
jgi:hypothetical protein